ncbi:MAG: hypothetical protein IJZ95_09320 [Oscillospiraceae bacterium]|nr:hypothetical protein [Oscillospiraceae bacterium]
MRKAFKQNLIEVFGTLYEAHGVIKEFLEKGNLDDAHALLCDCQNTAIDIGNIIIDSEGEGQASVSYLEQYCEEVYQADVELSNGLTGARAKEILDEKLACAENSVKNDIKVRLEVVFMPYKASMWDSLESVWKAADADPDCDAYVVPIPYFDRNSDFSMGTCHYEGNDFPDYVPVTHYAAYDLSLRQPDIIYIHNPYDNLNTVTSVDPGFYSFELKKYTECLVYIPYFATSGWLGEGKGMCPVYNYVDYIVIQSEKYRSFYHSSIPAEKLLPFGSPKYDRVINACKQPRSLPSGWKQKTENKKVFFYNTSIGGLLSNTGVLLRKMQYVFETFAKYPQACIVWRPHPLLESTIDSMRPQYKTFYNALKNFFVSNDIGILDTTPDITNTIALCDAYIGDPGSSVVSLFGVAAKPIFQLDNFITDVPAEDDWRGQLLDTGFRQNADNKWLVTMQNRLFLSENNDYNYKYICQLNQYSNCGYYLCAVNVGQKTYVCPVHARDILMIGKNGVEKRIELENRTEQVCSFVAAHTIGKYIFLIPCHYNAIVRYDTETDEVRYIENYNSIFTAKINGELTTGGSCVHNGKLYLASPVDSGVLVIDPESCMAEIVTVKTNNSKGCYALQSDGEALWFLPMNGKTVVCWNTGSGRVSEFSDMPQEFACHNLEHYYLCEEKPFSTAVFCGDHVYLSPKYANMFVKLNKSTGRTEQWETPFTLPEDFKNGYFRSSETARFADRLSENVYTVFSLFDRKLYKVDLLTNEYEEIPVVFDQDEVRNNEAGFAVFSQWHQYCANESAFYTLPDFIENNVIGRAFDPKEQIRAYDTINASPNGDCGKKVHQYIKDALAGEVE